MRGPRAFGVCEVRGVVAFIIFWEVSRVVPSSFFGLWFASSIFSTIIITIHRRPRHHPSCRIQSTTSLCFPLLVLYCCLLSNLDPRNLLLYHDASLSFWSLKLHSILFAGHWHSRGGLSAVSV